MTPSVRHHPFPAKNRTSRLLPRKQNPFRRAFGFFLLLLLTIQPLANARAQERMIFIRDAEIEHYLRDLGSPIFRAAGLDPQAVTLSIIQNGDLNAFVAGGMNMFFYTGLLLAADTPDELQGVIAHETGHIAGGHLMRGSEAMRDASAQAILGMLAGLAVGVAAGRGDVALGAMTAGQTIAERNLLSFSRAQEASADAAALRFLDASGQGSQGFLAFMQKLGKQEFLPADRRSEYVRTHPLSQDRVDSIRYHLENSKLAGRSLPPALALRHERMKAKLLGYLQPEAALLRYTDKDPRPAARYARAIALYRKSQLDRALPLMNGLIEVEPNNPYFYELKGQMLFESGRVNEAVAAYQKAVQLAPDQALLRVAYAHTLLEQKDPSKLDLAIENLLEANRLEAHDPQTWRFLAAAWGRKGESSKDPLYQGLVSYAFAEEAIAEGQSKNASQYADRALKTLPKSSPYWLRAQDIKLSDDEGRND